MTARSARRAAARRVAAGLACAAGAVMVVAACGGKATPQGRSAADAASALAARKQPIFVKGFFVTTLGERTIGPFLARRPNGRSALAAWVTAANGSARKVVAMPLGGDGEPRGPEKTLANVGVDTTSLVVKNLRGPAPGYVVAWTELTDRGEALRAIAVGDDGAPRGKPIELARTNDDIVWVDVVPTDLGAVCLWAVETRAGDANVVAAGLDTDGKVRAVASRIARGVTGWQALEVPGGVGVAIVSPPSGSTTAPVAPKGGLLSFQRLDPEGRPLGGPVPIVTRPVVSGDVGVARRGAGLVFAWTDRTGDEPAVSAAALDERGVLTPARPIVERSGGAVLLGLASGPAGAAAMWESPARHGPADAQHVHVARIGATLAPEGRLFSLETASRAAPEIAPTGTGFAVLAPARACDPKSTSCAESLVVPEVVRLDATGAAVQRELLDFRGDPAAIGWGLACVSDTCVALAASGDAPARVRAASILPRVNVATEAPGVAPGAPAVDGPRVTDVVALSTGESVSDLASSTIDGATMLATLAVKSGAPAKGEARAQAHVLSTRTLDADGAASAPSVVSTRALAVGGVAIAPAEKPDDGAAVAWVARDNGHAEVHVTRVDKKGKRTNDVQLTTTKGDASDVALAWADGGWIVAWVDTRDGNGEVYATKVGLDLTRVAREERITNAPGDAGDLVAMGKGDLVWLAWADPRESPRDGTADVYATAVRKRDAKRALGETRLVASAAHSRTPELVARGDEVVVAWIEEAPMGADEAGGFGAFWVTLDERGVASRPARLPVGGDGAATSLALEAVPGGFRGVVARSTAEAIALDAFEVPASGEPRATPLMALDGPPSLDVALVLARGTLYFNDDGPAPSDKRARRARIAWRP